MEGIKMQDAGYVPEKGDAMAMPVADEGKKKNEKRYPTMYVNDKEMPAIKGMEAGKEYLMMCKVKVTRYSENTNSEADKGNEHRCDVNLDILQAGFKPVGKKNAEEMSEQELSDDETEVETGTKEKY